jgi:hypothetical protein
MKTAKPILIDLDYAIDGAVLTLIQLSPYAENIKYNNWLSLRRCLA